MNARLPVLGLSVLILGAGVFQANEPEVFGTPGAVVYPVDNPYSKAKADLGRRLFLEPALSKNRETPCSWCHEPRSAWQDRRILSLGDPRESLNRNTPTLLNVAYMPMLFWDGRSKSLEEQVLFPIEHPKEMNLSRAEIPARLKAAGYSSAFEKVFGTKEITPERVAKAIATFERTLIEVNTPYDQYRKGDKTALSTEALKGLGLFKGKANCVSCHSGPMFTRATNSEKSAFANTGVYQSPILDPDAGHNGEFRIPSLRGVGKTAPYMHNGSLKRLEDVVAFYSRGGDFGKLPALNLTEAEQKALVSFLKYGLTSETTAGEDE
jgi:cytochrome c peroxidase